MKVMFNHKLTVGVALILACFSFTAFFSLASSSVLADDIVDNVSIKVQVSCTMSGTGTNTHNATVNPGTYETNIGLTTFNVFCNDNEGFAIYAIGYTDDTEGKNVLTNSSAGSTYDIATGTGTSGNSQWAMKLATDSGATYPIALQNSFNNWHTVPNDYTLVAKRTADTDVGVDATGASFTSTYQVFASSDQPSGSYSGRVKYVMVHPNNTSSPVEEDQIAVVFESNGSTFSGGTLTNRVVYGGENCNTRYIGNTPLIVKSGNLADDGTRLSPFIYSDENDVYQVVTIDGADGILVEIDYGLRHNAMVIVAEGEWDGVGYLPPDGYDYIQMYGYSSVTWGADDNSSGTKTFIAEGDTVTIKVNSYDGGNYGAYAKVYPIYETQRNNTRKSLSCVINATPVEGSYTEVLNGNGAWFMQKHDDSILFPNEEAVFNYIDENQASLLGTTIYLRALNTYGVSFKGNNATTGTMNNYYEEILFADSALKVQMVAPNFYKAGYGFAGWSEDPNATPDNGAKIFGPNEKIPASDLNLGVGGREVPLYAVWIPSDGSLQNWSGCPGLRQGKIIALTDTRDNQTYSVAKLADGNCWMIENLRLGTTGSSESAKAQGFGGIFSGLANAESSNFNSSGNANSKYSTNDFTGNNLTYRIPRYNNVNTNSLGSTFSSFDANLYGYGNIYTWAAAMANTSDLTTAAASESANTSICPKGWRLPVGDMNNDSNNDFRVLTGYYNGSADFLFSYPNNFVAAGSFVNSGFNRRGWRAQYWSSTAVNGTNASSFEFYNGGSQSVVSTGKYAGLSIRCLIKN